MLNGSQPSPSTQPAPLEQTQTSDLAPYEGMRVYARGLALSARVPDGYVLPGIENRGWDPDPHVPSVLVNARHPDHIAYDLGYEAGWRVVQRVRKRPSLAALHAAADSLAGVAVTLVETSVFPRALRTPIRLAPSATLTLDTDPARCRPFGPSSHEEIDGLDVEHRLARTTDSSGRHTLYAEAFVKPHRTVDGKPRAVLYLPDARRVLRAERANAAARFMAQLLDSLFVWILVLEGHGVGPDDRRLRLPLVAVAHAAEEAGGVFFDAQMPGPKSSDPRRIATCGSGGFMQNEGDTDAAHIFDGLADKPCLLARPGLHVRDEVAGLPHD